MFAFGQPVTILHRTQGSARDNDGNFAPTTVSVTVQGAFAPRGSTEIVQGQDVVITQPTVYLPPGTVIGPADAVTVAGVTYQVDGAPNAYVNPFTGWQPGVEVKLREVTG